MHSQPTGRVLIIAGSDSGGGAGIQGDIKTVTALGGYAMTAITALTAQNTLGVFGIHPIPDDFIAQQIDLCLSDIGADAIKTGMLHSASVIETVVACLEAHYLAHNRAASASLSLRERDGVRAEHAHHSKNAKQHITLPLPTTLQHAHDLRQQQTDAENRLWQHLRNRQLGVKFRRQHPLAHYILDFVCLESNLVIELDGGQHATDGAVAYDTQRSALLAQQGLRVLRFWNHDVLQNTEGVLATIQAALADASPSPNPLPQGEGFPAAQFGDIPLVVDPVMVAKGGAALLEQAALTALKTKLIPRAALITPNLPEAELLLGRPIPEDKMEDAARALLDLGAQAVLLKGGHGTGATLTDILVSRSGPPLTLTTARVDTRHTHGTGCTFASAIATGIAQSLPLEEAVIRAHAYVQDAIANAPGFGGGNGPLGHYLAR